MAASEEDAARLVRDTPAYVPYVSKERAKEMLR
jgi:hypothetical protein